jgi:hypothetical protein
MKGIGDTAFVVSVHYEASTGILRVNLKWQGEHDVSAFDALLKSWPNAAAEAA